MTSAGDKGIGIRGWITGQKPEPKAAETKQVPVVLDRHRIAVLPLSSISPDSKDEYFADGMTEELISALYKVPGLSVISRTSVMQYKNQAKQVGDIGRELSVGTLLEGSVRKAGNRVRIAVQLIDASTDNHLWAENYDRDLEDIFAIQSEIAQNVANSLNLHLHESVKEKIGQAATKDAEAYTLYLKGCSHLERATEEEFMAALGYFEQAVQKDPGYAHAYAAMSAVYFNLGSLEIMPSRDALAKAEKLARKALETDDSLAEAHLSMSYVLKEAWDWKGSDREIQRALKLNPSLAEAHLALASQQFQARHFDEALPEGEKALELDPLSNETLQWVGTLHLYGGYVERAVELYKKVLERDPANSFAMVNLGLCYVRKGLYDDGIAQIKKGIEMSASFDPSRHSDLAYALVKAGRMDEAREVLAQLIRFHEERSSGAAAVAFAYACLKEKEKAFEWLEIAYKEHSGYLMGVAVDFAFEEMRSDPRFQAFLRKMGLTRSG